MTVTIGVVGTGNMGSALVKGWMRAPLPGVEIVVYDKIEESARHLASGVSVLAVGSLEELARRAEVIVVVVKPKDTGEVLASLSQVLRPDQVVVSSAAGLGLSRLRALLGPGPALFRMMPNLGVQLGAGVVTLCAEPAATSEDVGRVRALFECMGIVEVLPEGMLNAVTAVAGSSIGFLALALEGIEDGAVRVGMPRKTARTFVRQTALATAQLLVLQPGSAAELKDQVASPGGTTIAGLAVLEDQGVRGAFLRAIEAATDRGRQLEDES
ncbi:MAG TPA: pyrroline-5-carboxylate reductase [Thermoleophilia bacterium]|jgi:pyrroline-5-carboxylate reductase